MAYELIDSTTLTGTTQTILFSSIPQTYNDLVLSIDVEGDTGNDSDIYLEINGSSSSISNRGLTNTASVVNTGNNEIMGNEWYARDSVSAAASFYFVNYTTTDKRKSAAMFGGLRYRCFMGAIQYSGTSAITSLALTTVTYNFDVYSTVSLWGVS